MRLLRRKKAATTEASEGSAIVLSINNNNRGLDFLVDLIKQVRPSSYRNKEESHLKFQALLYRLLYGGRCCRSFIAPRWYRHSRKVVWLVRAVSYRNCWAS